jgi:AcrR family transcriptional regulator
MPTKSRRTPLSRDRVLHTALALADEIGVESLSMRRLAKELGVEAMSLYNHVRDKEDLLSGLVDLVFAEIEPPTLENGWREAMRERANATRQALRRHPWAIGLMEARAVPGPSNIRLHEAVLKCHRESGFSVAATANAYSVQDAFIYGFALQEKALPDFDQPEIGAEVAARQLNPALMAEFPYLAEMVGGHVASDGYSLDEAFEVGLEVVLDGAEKLRDQHS